MKEHVFGPINLFDPRKFCGLDSFKIDFFQTLKDLVNPDVKEHISKDGSSIIEVSGTNIYKKIYFKFLFSSKNDFLVTSLLVNYEESFVLYESEYSDIAGLEIKFPKQLTKKWLKSKKDLDNSKDNWEHFEKYEVICYPNYKINDDLFKFATPEGYVVKDLIRNPNDKIHLKR